MARTFNVPIETRLLTSQSAHAKKYMSKRTAFPEGRAVLLFIWNIFSLPMRDLVYLIARMAEPSRNMNENKFEKEFN